MNNFVNSYTSQWSSFQTIPIHPGEQADLAAWLYSMDGPYTYLAISSSTPPAGSSTPTIDPVGTYSGPGASAPTPVDPGTYILVTGATSVAAEIIDPAGTYSGAGRARRRPTRPARIAVRARLLRPSIQPAVTAARARASRRLRSPGIMSRRPAPAARRGTIPTTIHHTRARRRSFWRCRRSCRAR